MTIMKVAVWLWTCLLLGAQNPPVSGVRVVYMLPMGSGLDQFIANRLTNKGVFQVATDAKKADAVFTDQLGERFENRMKELYPEPEAEAEKTDEDSDDEEKPKEDAKPVRMSGWGRGHGNIFLVDTKSRQVLWSVYDKPKNTTPEQLDRTAARIVTQLQKDLGRK